MPDSFNIAEAKSHFSEILGRVALQKATIIITRRGRPLAKIVPIDQGAHLADVPGWLDDDDPLFAQLEQARETYNEEQPRPIPLDDC